MYPTTCAGENSAMFYKVPNRTGSKSEIYNQSIIPGLWAAATAPWPSTGGGTECTEAEDLLLTARKVALDQRTSVNQLVREYLARLVEEPSRRRLARARLRKAFDTGLVRAGDRKWSRDELYDR